MINIIINGSVAKTRNYVLFAGNNATESWNISHVYFYSAAIEVLYKHENENMSLHAWNFINI